MGRIISCCVWGLLSIILYLFIVVTFNQEYGYHTGIPVSIYVFVGCFIVCDMYSIASFLIMVLWKQCLRHGVACSYHKNANIVAHFIGSIYHFCISGCFSVFLLLIVGSVLFTAAAYVAYPKCWKYCTLICLKGFLKASSFIALIYS